MTRRPGRPLHGTPDRRRWKRRFSRRCGSGVDNRVLAFVDTRVRPRYTSAGAWLWECIACSELCDEKWLSPGGPSEAAPPVPIPNTAVKRLSADDTAPARTWENRSLPGGFAFYGTEDARRGTVVRLNRWSLRNILNAYQKPQDDTVHVGKPLRGSHMLQCSQPLQEESDDIQPSWNTRYHTLVAGGCIPARGLYTRWAPRL